MSSIVNTPKIKTVRTLNNRILNLLIIAALGIVAAFAFVSFVGFTNESTDHNTAYLLYRQGEVAFVSIPVTGTNNVNADLSTYLLSERTFVEQRVDMTTYFQSERTSIPLSFTAYQLSEWFGK